MPTDAKNETSTKPPKRIDGVNKIDGFEGHRADELVKQWSENYRARNPDKLKTRAEIEQAIVSSQSDWRTYALAEVAQTRALWRARKPATAWAVSELGPLALSKQARAEDLGQRIEALQHDLAAFKLSHGGEPQLDAKILAWLRTVVDEG